MRRQLEDLVVGGELSVADFKGLLPGASAVWHEPRYQPPRSRPQVWWIRTAHVKQMLLGDAIQHACAWQQCPADGASALAGAS